MIHSEYYAFHCITSSGLAERSFMSHSMRLFCMTPLSRQFGEQSGTIFPTPIVVQNLKRSAEMPFNEFLQTFRSHKLCQEGMWTGPVMHWMWTMARQSRKTGLERYSSLFGTLVVSLSKPWTQKLIFSSFLRFQAVIIQRLPWLSLMVLQPLCLCSPKPVLWHGRPLFVVAHGKLPVISTLEALCFGCGVHLPAPNEATQKCA